MSDMFRQAGFRATARVGRARRPVTGVPDEWPSILARGGQNPAYRPSGFFNSPLISAAYVKTAQGIAFKVPLTSHKVAGIRAAYGGLAKSARGSAFAAGFGPAFGHAKVPEIRALERFC